MSDQKKYVRYASFDPVHARKLRNQGLSYREIGKRVGACGKTVQRHLDEDYAHRELERKRALARETNGLRRSTVSGLKEFHMAKSGDTAARLAEIPVDTRDLTKRVCGDPLPGRSALDQRRAG